MLLRIIDKQEIADNNTVEIVFESDTNFKQYTIELYESPFSNNFYKSLAWYFSDYLYHVEQRQSDKAIVEKLITRGKNLGDGLLGEDHELIQVSEFIEEQGYSQLHVQVESPRPDFFQDFWEALILPEAKYILSSVCASFTRVFVDANYQTKDYPELSYDLQVTAPVTEMLQDNKSEEHDNVSKADEPLRILYLISRPQALLLPFDSSNAINSSLDTFSTEGALRYEICSLECWQQLEARLKDHTRPVHILHYDGPVLVSGKNIGLVTSAYAKSADAFCNIRSLSTLMVENKIPLLSVDARAYFREDETKQQYTTVSPGEALAFIALQANDAGLGNVIGLGQLTDPWTSSQCFQAVYQRIVMGFSLGQAVVEARKALQSATESDRFTVPPIPFHPWPLLIHYGGQTLTFFAATQHIVSMNESQVLQQSRQALLGFQSSLLPPTVINIADGQLVALLTLLQPFQLQHENPAADESVQALNIIGESGSGKSHLSHQLSLYLLQEACISFGFYFDYQNDLYLSEHIVEMIAPVFELSPSTVTVEVLMNKLAQQRCYFVFDNILPSGNGKEDAYEEIVADLKQREALYSLMSQLIKQGHILVFTGQHESAILNEALGVQIKTVDTKPLLAIEQSQLAVQCTKLLSDKKNLSEKAADSDWQQGWQELLGQLNGHPWLIKKSIPLLVSSTPAELSESICEYINTQTIEPKTEQFYVWQWEKIPLLWQRLLLLCTEIDGLLLEMLMVAWDQKQAYAPAQSLQKLLGENAKLPRESVDEKVDKDDSESNEVETVKSFAQAIELWQISGFLNTLSFGRIIDTRCLGFLRKQKKSDSFSILNTTECELYFSQLLCEGIRLLSSHVVNQQNPALSHNLLINRRFWVPHFESLWFAHDYKGFMGVKNAFDQLLQQARLSSESAAWCEDLLERTAMLSFADTISAEEKLSWLALAAFALNHRHSDQPKIADGAGASKAGKAANQAENTAVNMMKPVLMQGAEICQEWVNQLTDTIEKNEAPLFQQVNTYLEIYYQKTQNWQAAIDVCQRACEVYRQYEAWQQLIQSLKALARYSVELKKMKDAFTYEEQILNDIPYDNAPPDFQSQQILEIIISRVSRDELEAAQTLLNQLKSSDDAGKFTDMLEGLQSDIYYRQENYHEALPYYCKMWVRALQAQQEAQIAQLKQRLLELEEKLGDDFTKVFTELTPDDTLKPKDVETSLH